MSEVSGSTPSQNSIPASDASGNSDGDGLERLCNKVHKKLGVPSNWALPVADHNKAVDYLQRIRDALIKGAEITSESRTALVCAGVACARRIHAGSESEETAALLCTTSMLLFALLVLSEGTGIELENAQYHPLTREEQALASPPAPRRVLRDDEQLIAAWGARTLADTILKRDDAHASSWTTALRSDAMVSRAALKEARYVNGEGALTAMQTLATIFYRCSASAITDSMMGSVARAPTGSGIGGASFLTLDSMNVMQTLNNVGGADQALMSLADAAESEAGQQVLRDLILSFKLPQGVVGVRRTLLLGRETNLLATKNYTEVLNAAHEAAMRGANWSWASDPDPIHKMSAVLAGLAVILAKTPDSVRKGDAFGGRVGLPFVDCAPPEAGTLRLGLIASAHDWVVYKTNSAGKPRITCRSSGYDGFCECVLLFANSVRS